MKTVSRAIGTLRLARDLGLHHFGDLSCVVLTDSASAKGTASRRGTGRIRHLETGALWIQAVVQSGRVTTNTCKGRTTSRT